jgi:hypothetical protein
MNLCMNLTTPEGRPENATIWKHVNDAKFRVVIVEDSPIIRARLTETLSEIPNLEIIGRRESSPTRLRCSAAAAGTWLCSICN